LGQGWTTTFDAFLTSEMWNRHWLMPVSAVVGLGLAGMFDRASKIRWVRTLAISLISAPLLALIVSGLASGVHSILQSTGFDALFEHVMPASRFGNVVTPEASSRAAMLLLLEFGLFYFARAFPWVLEPMNKSNLGSIRLLQDCATSQSVKNCFDKWRDSLQSKSRPEDPVKGPAAVRVRVLVREALWRDIMGFIPVYTLVVGFGMWFASHKLAPGLVLRDIQDVPVWYLPPLIALLADYAEDALQLSYVRSMERNDPPKFAWLAFTMTQIKLVAFLGGLIVTLGAFFVGSREVIADGAKAGWSGAAALVVFGVAIVALLLFIWKQAHKYYVAMAK